MNSLLLNNYMVKVFPIIKLAFLYKREKFQIEQLLQQKHTWKLFTLKKKENSLNVDEKK